RIHTMSAWASRVAPLANAVAGSASGRWLIEQLFGIDRRRTLPPWARRTFAQQFRERERQRASSAQPRHDQLAPEPRHESPVASPQSPAASPKALAPTVILFTDTFTNYNHPDI